jgi:hypothetical protein
MVTLIDKTRRNAMHSGAFRLLDGRCRRNYHFLIASFFLFLFFFLLPSVLDKLAVRITRMRRRLFTFRHNLIGMGARRRGRLEKRCLPVSGEIPVW